MAISTSKELGSGTNGSTYAVLTNIINAMHEMIRLFKILCESASRSSSHLLQS